MELYQLEYFEAVARHENVSKAAEELHISQPALSKSIAKLESELGVQLFDRAGKRISLSMQGAFFRDSVAKLLVNIEESTKALRNFDSAYEGSVSVVVRGPQKEALACTMSFIEQNPNVFVGFNVQHSNDKSSAVWEADVVFAPIGIPFKPSVGVPYAERELALVVPESHWLPDGEKVDLSRLAGEPFAFLVQPYEFYEMSHRLCIDSGFSPDVRFVTSSKPALLEWVRDGHGVGFVDGSISRWGRVAGIRILSLERDSIIRSLCIACRKFERMTPAARRFADFAFDYFKIPEDKRHLAVYERL